MPRQAAPFAERLIEIYDAIRAGDHELVARLSAEPIPEVIGPDLPHRPTQERAADPSIDISASRRLSLYDWLAARGD